MANDQDSAAEFRPFVAGAFKPNQYIQAGGQTSTPYLRGVQDLAYNHNTLVANVQHELVAQHANDSFPAITYTATPISFAKYIIYIPGGLGRTALNIKVVADCSVATYAVRGVTGAATGTMSTPVATGVEATCTVTVDAGGFKLLTLDFELSAGGTFTPQSVYVTLDPYASTTLSFVNTNVVPQDVDQYGADRPLAVVMLRDLIRTNNQLYLEHRRCIQNWSYWGDWAHATTPVTTADVGLNGPTDTRNTKQVISQLYYRPKQGVKQLALFAAGRTKSYPTTTEGIYFRFSSDMPWVGAGFATATTVTTEGSWAIWDVSLPVPNNSTSPIYVDIGVESSSNKAYTQAFAVYERASEEIL